MPRAVAQLPKCRPNNTHTCDRRPKGRRSLFSFDPREHNMHQLQRLTRGVARSAVAISMAAAIVVQVGCQTQDNHEKWVGQANTRWNSVRSAVILDMATQHFEAGDLDQAEIAVRDGLVADATNAKLITLAGRIAIERGKLERAYHMFNSAMTHDPKLPTPHYYQGLVHQRWQQFEKAAEQYRMAYELEPDNPAYLLAVSEMLVAQDRNEQALALLTSKLEYFDQNAGVRASIGHLYSMRRNYVQAVRMFRDAALLDPDNRKLQEELAVAQVAAGRNQEAISTLEQLLSRKDMDKRPDLYRALATACLAADEPEKARDAYNTLLRQPGASVDDWVQYAELTWRLGDIGATLTAANRVVQMDEGRYEGYLLAGMVWHKRGRTNNALQMFDLAAKKAPDNPSPLILRGIALQKDNRYQAAAVAYREALERDPKDTRAMRLLAAVESTP